MNSMTAIEKIEYELGLKPEWRAYPHLLQKYGFIDDLINDLDPNKISDLEFQISELEVKNEDLEQKKHDLDEEVEELTQEIEELKDTNDDLQEEIKKYEELLSAHGIDYLD